MIGIGQTTFRLLLDMYLRDITNVAKILILCVLLSHSGLYGVEWATVHYHPCDAWQIMQIYIFGKYTFW